MARPRLSYRNVVLTSPDEVVHLEYFPDALAPKPSNEWTRFVCISDTHTRVFNVPDGDVLLHSGDLTNIGLAAEFKKTVDWLCSLPHKVKIIIAGNHDLTLDDEWYQRNHTGWHTRHGKQNIEAILQMLQGNRAKAAGLVYLQNEKYEFRLEDNGRLWTVFGSPWSPEFFDWAFNYERGDDANALISQFPKTDILLTHGPPYQILDRVVGDEDVGCEALRARLHELRPRIHLFGHIHEAHGAHIHTWNRAQIFQPPRIQNTDPVVSTSNDSLSEDTGSERLERTVFVNAASWPSGEIAERDGVRPPFGGPGFQPVVVDLKG